MTRGSIDRGHIRLRLIRELAQGDKSQRRLASEYGVVSSAITDFKKKYAQEIEDIRADFEARFAGLWIAEKQNRVAAYQQQAEDTARLIERHLKPSEDPDAPHDDVPDSTVVTNLHKAQARALRSVAEELGQLPNRMTVVPEGQMTVRHIIEGVDIDAV